jgi:phenylacetate-CoA ligase
MPSFREKLYLSFPAFRNVGATIQGFNLNRQRYGNFYAEAVDQIYDRDRLTRQELADYQTKRLQEMVQIAANHVPYYKKLFAELGLTAKDIQTPEDLHKIPVLEKDFVRANPLQFLDERLDAKKLCQETTTGTTGTPIKVFMTPRAMQTQYAFLDARCRFKIGLYHGNDPYVTFGVRHVVQRERTKPPFWCYNASGKQLYMSVYHLAPQFLRHYCDELKRRPYKAVVGFPSALTAIAKYILDYDVRGIHIPVAMTSGETLRLDQRITIEKAFGCRLFDQYGCSELSIFGAELRCGHMHISSDYGIVEVLDDSGKPVPHGRPGQLVCTGLVNDAQIFLRYRIGDVAAWSSKSECRSALPILGALEGRTANAIVLADGRKMFRMSAIDATIPTIKGYQIVQEAVGQFTIYIEPSEQFEPSHKIQLVKNFTANVGPADIQVTLVNRLERGPGGKFASIVSKVSA